MSITRLNLTTEPDLTATTTEADEQEERELVWSVNPLKQQAVEVEVEFRDGHKKLPGWLVANLGGPEIFAQPHTQARLKRITFESFMGHWNQQNFQATVARQLFGVRNKHVLANKKGNLW